MNRLFAALFGSMLVLGTAPEAVAQPAAEPPRGWPARFGAEVLLAQAYDSNINHNDTPVASYGVVPGLRVRYRSAQDDPLLTVVYVVAVHSYTNTDRWDRVSNAAVARLTPELSDRWHAETEAVVSLRGSSEDRDISNQYSLSQTFEYRFDRDHRLQLYGTYRLKRFPEDPDEHARKPHLGLHFERRLDAGRRWELGTRYERNIERDPRGNYRRWKFDFAYRTPYFASGHQLRMKARYRRKYYAAKFVEIEDEDRLRRDQRWILGVAWRRVFGAMQVEAGYTFEARDSLDPDRPFTAHMIEVGLAYRLW